MEALSMRLLPLFDWLLWTTIQAALLFCLIMLVQLILRSRLPIRWHYCLWLLLLVRLAIPWLPESRISVFNLVPRSIQQGRILESYSEPQNVRGMRLFLSAKTADSEDLENNSEAISVRFARMLPLLWLLGTVALAVYVGAGNFRLWWLVTRERPLTDQKTLDLLEDCKAEMGVRNILGIVTTNKVKSAALFGFIRPRLLLPAGMIETLSREELRYVFLHELGHLRRRDIYVGWLMSLLQVLHWFNPLVWLAFYRMQSDRELACDALVLTHTRSGESKEYGRTIVNLLERFSRPQRLPSMAGILETRSQLKRRIKMIAKFKKTSRTRWAGAMLLFAVLACVVLTNAYVAKADFTFGTPTNLGPTVNSSDRDGSPSISADGLELYFGSNRSGGSGDYDLWVTTRDTKDDEWGPPMNLGPTVNSSSHECDPSISSDGLSLFLRVRGPGGFGRDDLWVTTRATSDDDWDPRVNLGPTVNTAFAEFGPSISADDLTLFFRSSNRPGGYGKGDLYVTMRATTSDPWSTPVNLGSTVNTSSSDADPSISSDGLTLFFHSDRPGGLGPPDLWQVRIEPIVDLNGDGIVDSADICIIIDHWGTDQPLCDVGPMPWGDGIVDVQDLIVLAEHLFEEFPPIALWNMDETEGSIAYDSIDENDGTLNGGPLWQPGGGKVGGSLWLDGVDDYVATPFILDPAKGSFSIFAWIKGGGPVQVIISQKDITEGRTTNPGSAWLLADARHGRLITRLMHPPFDPLVSESVITDGQWHHVGLVYDFDGLHRHLYVDGAEVAKDSDVVGGVGSNGGLYFGAGKMLEQGSFFSGLIDDVRIYDEVLSAEEVAELAH